MSLEFGLEKNGEMKFYSSFEDDGYFWYLWPFFEEINKTVGIEIDLYGDAKFTKGNINHLELALKRAKNKIVPKNNFLIYEFNGVKSKLSKTTLLKKIKDIEELIEKVKSENCKIIFIGD